ncbi:response regulator transcription factor [Candidatus Marinarcus aquaticus]|uniref:DNA-binding response regulator n=1 Tax=Candidatus Marinarcus aquaticus TaxID=2044504 RepID=A0A4Q0XQP5_9BACT|nr:response regulator transcription factor [Candidatus Marinarcus aquaticus]RXJ58002.1 DNA-binding response regulator [Candidatus Marinarcus aquaticus]
MKILLLEDDAILSDLTFAHLNEQGFITTLAEDGEEALAYIENEKFDLFIFDINVPKLSGLKLLKQVREYAITTPIIMITAYQDTEHLKKGFDFGCDDYIKKPFDLEELTQRIKNLAKRFNIEDRNVLQLKGGFYLDMNKHLIGSSRVTYEISYKESQILKYLFLQKGRVVGFDELVQNIWYFDDIPSETTIRVYIKNIRKILGKDSIRTIRGVGYCYE